MRKAFENFDKKFNRKQVNLSKQREDSINLNIVTLIDDDEEIKKTIELKQYKIEREDVIQKLLSQSKEMQKEIFELKKNISEMNKKMLSIQENLGNDMNKKLELFFEDYLKRKKEEEEILNKEEEKRIQKEEELIRKKEEEKYNDNVNLFNDFQCQDINNIKDFDYIIKNFSLNKTSVAVYSIIRNNERLYELACIKSESKDHCNIVFYNIIINKKTNEIYNINSGINTIKHYYHALSKKHFLLSSNPTEIQLWNITSKIISKELEFRADYNNGYWNGHYCHCSCLLFNNENYLILSGGFNQNNKSGYKTVIFNKNGYSSNTIGSSKLEQVNYIETTYIENKPYVLLSGSYHSESYDYNNGNIKYYGLDNNEKEKSYSSIINLFKNKDNKIYLISGYENGKVMIFDFDSTEKIFSFKLGNSCIYGLCSLSKQYFLVGDNKEIKVVDFDKQSVVKSYNKDFIDGNIQGIKKIKIPGKGEIIISYTYNKIIMWK